MNNIQQQMAALSRRNAKLEEQLAKISAELAELMHLIRPFLERYRHELLYSHKKLIRTQRAITDARVQLGQEEARLSGEADTPLSRLVKSGTWPSVEEQYDRVWRGKETPRPDINLQTDLPPASERLKALYAEIVAKLHPELAEGSREKRRLEVLMSQVDEAYVQRNEIALVAVADAYRERTNLPTLVSEQTVKTLQNRVHRLEWIITKLEGQVFELRYGDIAQVRAYAIQAQNEGYDLIARLSEVTQAELEDAQQELKQLKERL